jgi:hypothetical protein
LFLFVVGCGCSSTSLSVHPVDHGQTFVYSVLKKACWTFQSLCLLGTIQSKREKKGAHYRGWTNRSPKSPTILANWKKECLYYRVRVRVFFLNKFTLQFSYNKVSQAWITMKVHSVAHANALQTQVLLDGKKCNGRKKGTKCHGRLHREVWGMYTWATFIAP